VEDPEFLHSLPLARSRWVVNTTSDRDQCLVLVQALKHHGYAGSIAITAHTAGDREMYLDAGADIVLLPYRDAAKEAADLIQASIGGAEEKPR